MKLNCDLGEGLDQIDAQVMPHLHMANIACGGHAGNTAIMQKCVFLAQNYGVQIGAHPGYPDKANMGRVSMPLTARQLSETMEQQVSRLADICEDMGATLAYIKPHGALYNDLLKRADLFETVVSVCASAFAKLPLVVQALPNNSPQAALAEQYKVKLCYEAFADRAYTDDGLLVPRAAANAVHTSIDTIVAQAESLTNNKGVFSENNRWLNLQADTLCVHSDTPSAVDALLAISQRLYNQ